MLCLVNIRIAKVGKLLSLLISLSLVLFDTLEYHFHGVQDLYKNMKFLNAFMMLSAYNYSFFGSVFYLKKEERNSFTYSLFLLDILGFPSVFQFNELLYLYYEQVTLRRTWAKMPLWHKTKLLYSLLFQAVFLPKPGDLVKMVGSLHKILRSCPSLHRVI